MKATPSPPSTGIGPDVGLFLMRAMLGVVFLFHGAQKLFGWFGGYGLEATAGFMESLGLPLPFASAFLAAATELVGGLALITGVGQRLLSIPLTFTMLVAAFTAHTGFSAQAGGMEYPLTLALFSAGLGLVGPGRLALRPRFAAASALPAEAATH